MGRKPAKICMARARTVGPAHGPQSSRSRSTVTGMNVRLGRGRLGQREGLAELTPRAAHVAFESAPLNSFFANSVHLEFVLGPTRDHGGTGTCSRVDRLMALSSLPRDDTSMAAVAAPGIARLPPGGKQHACVGGASPLSRRRPKINIVVRHLWAAKLGSKLCQEGLVKSACRRLGGSLWGPRCTCWHARP